MNAVREATPGEHRDLAHRGVSATTEDFTARLAAWVEFGGR